MIRAALLLIRTSTMSVLVLAAALLMLVDVMSSEPGDDADASSSMPSLAPLPKTPAPGGNAAAALRTALFDPERRPETLAGSIDDLRLGTPPPPPVAADVSLSGVLLAGGKRRAMLAVAGGRAGWSDIGADIGGWRVAAINAQGAVLERDGQTLALTIADRLRNRSKPHADAPPGGGAGPDSPPAGSGLPTSPPAGPDPLTAPDPVTPSQP